MTADDSPRTDAAARPYAANGDRAVRRTVSVPPMRHADDLRLAFDTSDLAAELALDYFGAGVSARLKADGTRVTDADRTVECLLRETLAAARPTDAFLGEEFGCVGESERVWILDPIDGTGFFLRGDPTGESMLPWRFTASRRSPSSPHPLSASAGGRPEAAEPSSRLGRAGRARRDASAFAPPRPSQAPYSMPSMTIPGLASRQRRPAHRQVRYRWSSWSEVSSTGSWPSATTPGTTHPGSCSWRRRVAGSPTRPADVPTTAAAVCIRALACMTSCSPRCTTRSAAEAPTPAGRSPGPARTARHATSAS